MVRGEVDVWERVAERGVLNDCLGRRVVMCRDPWDTAVEEVVEGIKRVEFLSPYTPHLHFLG